MVPATSMCGGNGTTSAVGAHRHGSEAGEELTGPPDAVPTAL